MLATLPNMGRHMIFSGPEKQQANNNGHHLAHCANDKSFLEDGSEGTFVSTKVPSWERTNLNEAIYPADSILQPYMEFARECEESADCFLLGSVLPVVAACLGRNVWMPWGDGRTYCNNYAILVGKPGDRKSSAIKLAWRLAQRVLPSERFLPETCSAEALFDAYCTDAGGCPDKLLVADDANPLLSGWAKSGYGEQVGKRFLNLYDCCPLSEAFRRNKNGNDGDVQACQRTVPETSTSMVLGATFNIAHFQGQEVRMGLARRFLYYVATSHGRMISRPEPVDQRRLQEHTDLFRRLTDLRGVACTLATDADKRWSAYQLDIRKKLQEIEGINAQEEAALSRLNSQPIQTLKVAMAFEACRRVYADYPWDGELTLDSLQCAIRHVEHCMNAAAYLDRHADRHSIRAEADSIHAQVQHGFAHLRTEDGIVLSKSQLTYMFCRNPNRPGSMNPEKLYGKVLPDLIERGLASKTERKQYVFKIED